MLVSLHKAEDFQTSLVLHRTCVCHLQQIQCIAMTNSCEFGHKPPRERRKEKQKNNMYHYIIQTYTYIRIFCEIYIELK